MLYQISFVIMPTKASPKKKEVKAQTPALKKKKVTAKPRTKQTETRKPQSPEDPTSEQKSQVFNELSPRDFKVIKELTNSKNKTRLEALKKAGVPLKKSDLTQSRDAVDRILRKPSARIAFRAICRTKGVDLTYLANHLKDGLEATRTISVIPGAQKKNGDQQDASGSSIEFVSVPDWSARHKYFQLAIDIENITVEEVAEGGTEESYVDKIVRLRKLVKDREQDQEAMDVEMVET